MTKKYPILSGKQIVSCLLKLGFDSVSQKGSHVKLCRMEKESKKIVIVPLHEELAVGTLKSVLLQANLSLEEFMKEL